MKYLWLLIFFLAVPCYGQTTEVFATNIDAGTPSTDLRWDRYTPITGGPKWPTIVCIHGGYYKSGNRGPAIPASDLAAAGYLVFAIETRLAPPHTEMTGAGPPGDPQADPPSDGRPPQQTDDTRRGIRAARADSHCNGWVGVIGFSSGGTMAMWYGLVGAAGDDKPDAISTDSGPQDFVDPNIEVGPPNNVIANYINVPCGNPSAPPCSTPFETAAKAASPFWLTATTTPPPVQMFNGTGEIIPSTQLTNMIPHLAALGGYAEGHVLSTNLHSSNYWTGVAVPGTGFSDVKSATIDFFNRAQAGITPTPTASPTPVFTPTATPTATPSATFTPTPTVTPTATIPPSGKAVIQIKR